MLSEYGMDRTRENATDDQNIKAFSSAAKKYHVDFALKKDTAAERPRYLLFRESRDGGFYGGGNRSLHKLKARSL